MLRRWASAQVVGAKILAIRNQRGETQEEFVLALGRKATDQGDLSRWERGEQLAPEEAIVAAAELGGVPLDEFTEEMPDTGRQDQREMLIAADWMVRIAGELRERAKSLGVNQGDTGVDLAELSKTVDETQKTVDEPDDRDSDPEGGNGDERTGDN